MTSKSAPQQPLLMIPGPIEFTHDVLDTMAIPTLSHVDAAFIEEFGTALENLRKVVLTTSGQPFILSGSGVLTWDVTVCNLMVPGDRALLVNTGHFGDRLGDCVEQYGFAADHVRPKVLGEVPSLPDIEAALRANTYKIVTITHVDTSTGVRTDVRAVADLVRRVSPQSFVVVDGVCSVGAEELRFDEWGVDAALTASQKAIGVPPGLALMVFSQRAMAAVKSRTFRVPNYFGDLMRWLPIMESYEQRKPSYFATPAVNLVRALNVSLKEVLKDGMDRRFETSRVAGAGVRRALRSMGLGLVAKRDEVASDTLSAILYPTGVDSAKLLTAVRQAGVVLAAGLHPDIRTTYFRLGHMGSKSLGDAADGDGFADVKKALTSIAAGLKAVGIDVDPEKALNAFRGE